MSQRNRGAAQVSLMWVIALSVILVFVVLFAFVSQQTISDTEQQRQAALEQRRTSDQRFEAKVEELSTLSELVGYIPEGASTRVTSLETLRSQVSEVASSLGSGEFASMEEAVPALLTAYNGVTQENANLKSQVAQLTGDLEARQAAHRTAIGEKDSTISDLRRQLEDAQSSFNTQLADLERQRDGLREQVRDQERSVSELRSRLDEQARDFASESQVGKQRRDILSEELNQVQRRAETPDGLVLAASAPLKKAWIDRGRLHRVTVGMEFDVRDPDSGRFKGRIKVTGVEDRRAEARILNTEDRFDPITADDQISNAVYDPERSPVAVLLGNGFGQLSESDMQTKLSEVGIQVRGEVDNEVDYLILGTPFFDEDTGEMVPWDSFEAYKISQALSVRVLPQRDAMDWLGL